MKFALALLTFAMSLSANPFTDRLMDDLHLCAEQRPEILDALDTLRSKGSIVKSGGDELRVIFVHL